MEQTTTEQINQRVRDRDLGFGNKMVEMAMKQMGMPLCYLCENPFYQGSILSTLPNSKVVGICMKCVLEIVRAELARREELKKAKPISL